MLDWLKPILGEHYSEEIDNKIAAEIGKAFVVRADFNNLNAEKKSLADTIKERDTQLETLKASGDNVETLKSQIAQLQATNAEATAAHEAEIKRLKIDTAVELALSDAKAKNVKAVKALLDLTNAELADDGSVKGLSEQIKKLAKAPDSSFLFAGETKQPGLKGLNPSEGSDSTPSGGKEPKDMSYDELCRYLAENPEAKL